jgi:adenosylcobalamin-dependent ribonucleoside-triphosphate reductase
MSDTNTSQLCFQLDPLFIEKFKNEIPQFGFSGLGKMVYMRTYSRIKDDGTKESWFETIQRVVNGCYSLQKEHINENNLGWDEKVGQASAQEMYERMFRMKFLPAGRSLWAMGTDIINKRKLFEALNNCAFRSTQDIDKDATVPFCFVMDLSMLGAGVSVDTLGAGKVEIISPQLEKEETFTIEDTREAWVESLRRLIRSYTVKGNGIQRFDYSKIRPAGVAIKTFGGVSSGPEPLKLMLETIRTVLDKNVGHPITTTTIADICNLIGQAVVAGNVRRTALAIMGDESPEFLNLKNYEKNPHRMSYGWTSNNSLSADIGMNYQDPAKSSKMNGEPGYVWLENCKAYSRMNNKPDYKDKRSQGLNPCFEQILESGEMCNLVEAFPTNCTDKADFLRTLKFAFLYAKTVTLGKTHWADTNRVMLRNRRIGCSISGIAQFLGKFDYEHKKGTAPYSGLETLRQWCEEGYKTLEYYDDVYSEWLAIPKSIKKTCIKPSGSISLLAGATPGMHYPESKYYIRRMRLSKNSDMLQSIIDAGYKVEPALSDPEHTLCVEIPVYVGECRTVSDVSMWEQLCLASFLQKHWSENSVSCTITFDPKEGEQIEYALNYFQYQLKSVSFLPKNQVVYQQAPYEPISKEQYESMSINIKPLEL